MTVRSTAFIRGLADVAGANPLQYTVPTGYTLIWKAITVTNLSSAAAAILASFGNPALGQQFLISTPSLAPNTSWSTQLYTVLEPGDQIWVWAAAGGKTAVWASGSLLQGIPFH